MPHWRKLAWQFCAYLNGGLVNNFVDSLGLEKRGCNTSLASLIEFSNEKESDIVED